MEKKKEPHKHKRINDILLGPLERPAIAWMVKRMPQWITPDILTYIGLGASFLIMLGYVLTNYNIGFLWLASFGFLLNWFGDSLDGSLARHRKIERPKYGFYIDHSVDTLSQVAVFLGLGLSPFVDFRIACIALIAYLMMDILVYLNTYVRGVFQISYGKLGPTEIRVIAILINSLIFFFGNPRLNIATANLSLFDLVMIVIAFLLFFFFITSMVKNAAEIAEEEKL